MNRKTLPLIELTINPEDNSFVSAVSIVENPAIESSFIAFSKNQKLENFSINAERKEIIGLAMRADYPIYRNSEQSGEYVATFSKATVRQIAQVFAQKGFFNNTNIEHSLVNDGSFVFQSYIVDSEKGINAPNGIEANSGDWVVGIKVLSDSVWQDIKLGKRTGFSVEGVFKMINLNTTISLSHKSAFDTLLDDLEAQVNDLIS